MCVVVIKKGIVTSSNLWTQEAWKSNDGRKIMVWCWCCGITVDKREEQRKRENFCYVFVEMNKFKLIS